MYEVKCNCGQNYIGEAKQNVTIRRDEHSDIVTNSEPARHLYQFPEQVLTGKFLEGF